MTTTSTAPIPSNPSGNISPRPRGFAYYIIDIILNLAIIAGVVFVVRTFVVSPFQIDGNSMVDTLENRQYIVINKFRYLFRKPSRGEVVVFRPPVAEEKYYVKRVIGIPGDTVVIRDGLVFIRDPLTKKNMKLEEPYLNEHNAGKTYKAPVNGGDTSEVVFNVPEGQYFLLGDNRQGSQDSRSFAASSHNATSFVPRSNIKGSVWFVALPISKIHALEPAVYSNIK